MSNDDKLCRALNCTEPYMQKNAKYCTNHSRKIGDNKREYNLAPDAHMPGSTPIWKRTARNLGKKPKAKKPQTVAPVVPTVSGTQSDIELATPDEPAKRKLKDISWDDLQVYEYKKSKRVAIEQQRNLDKQRHELVLSSIKQVVIDKQAQEGVTAQDLLQADYGYAYLFREKQEGVTPAKAARLCQAVSRLSKRFEGIETEERIVCSRPTTGSMTFSVEENDGEDDTGSTEWSKQKKAVRAVAPTVPKDMLILITNLEEKKAFFYEWQDALYPCTKDIDEHGHATAPKSGTVIIVGNPNSGK